VLSTTHSTAHV